MTVNFAEDFPLLPGSSLVQDAEIQISERISGLAPVPFAPKASRTAASRRRKTKDARKHDLLRAQVGREALSALMDVTETISGSGRLPDRLRSCYESDLANLGTEPALIRLKASAGSARSSWILRNGSDVQAQASFVGRALPMGTDASCEKSVAQHYEDLSSEFTSDRQLLLEARHWAHGWASRFLAEPVKMPASGLPTLSSCSESKVKEGGVRGFASRLGVHPRAAALSDELSADLPPQDVGSVISDLSLAFHGIDLVDAGLPASEVIPIRERGLKVRVITKSPAGLHFLGHVMRKRLLAGLRRDSSSSSPLVGVDDEGLINDFIGASDEAIVSTDLSRATDLLPLDLVSAIVEGLGASGKIPPAELEVLRILTGPQDIHYPSLPDSPTIRSKRAILMGLPTSWAILSLIHLFWWDRSIKTVALRRHIKLKVAFALNRFKICGDDALFCGMHDVALQYSRYVERSGGFVSAGKHFVVRGVPKRAVFLERLYQFHSESGLITGGFRHKAIPLRGLVRPEVADTLRGHGSSLTLSSNLKLIFSIDSIWRSHPGGVQGLVSFLRKRQHLYTISLELGLVNGVPMGFGGSGLPTPHLGLDALKRRYRGALSSLEGRSFPALVRGVIDPLWQMCEMMATGDLNDLISGGTFIVLPDDAPKPADVQQAEHINCGSLESMIASACASMYSDYALSMGSTGVRPRLRERKLKAAIKTWVEGLPPLPADWSRSDPLPSNTDVVWVRRTRGPSGSLLFPRWAGESLASEALSRGLLFSREARFLRAST